MTPLLGRNLPQLKRLNRSTVLQVLLRYGPLSRRDIGQITRLTPATITNITAELIANSLVIQKGSVADDNEKGSGRKKVLLDLNPTGGYVGSVHIGARASSVAIADLKANILQQTSFRPEGGATPEAVLPRIAEGFQHLINKGEINPSQILGLGVGAMGIVDPEKGTIKIMPEIGWQEVPIRQELERTLSLPVVVDNSVRTMALAEAWFGRSRDVGNLLMIFVGASIESGLIIDRQIYRGTTYAAGQIGHLILQENGPPCPYGHRGCLNALASGVAIAREGAEAAAKNPDTLIHQLVGGRLEQISAPVVVEAANKGDKLALSIMERAGQYLGMAIANALNLFDPEAIIISGRIALNSSAFLQAAKQTAQSRSLRGSEGDVQIVPTSFGPDVAAVGPAALALSTFLYSPMLTLPSDMPRRRWLLAQVRQQMPLVQPWGEVASGM
ncbi:MAG: ROK family protein [Chloroflexi bacterium]|nr:ROK family protein [Chloroflexota bacterium]MCL5075083.1 ROK family protein [Chloroflexota bacterium]